MKFSKCETFFFFILNINRIGIEYVTATETNFWLFLGCLKSLPFGADSEKVIFRGREMNRGRNGSAKGLYGLIETRKLEEIDKISVVLP